MIGPRSIETRPCCGRRVVEHTEARRRGTAVRAAASEREDYGHSIEYLDAGTRAGRADWRGLMLKTAVVLPDVIISSLMGLVVVAALPPVIGLCIIAAWMAASACLAAGLGEAELVRILHGARRATPTEVARLAIPGRIVAELVDTNAVRVRIVTHGPAISTFGRRHVLLAQQVVHASSTQIIDAEVAALMIQGIGRLRLGHTRFDLLWGFWSAPWHLVRGVIVDAGRQLAWVPLGRFAWKTRFIVGTIAVILEAQAGRWPSPIIIAGFMTLSYLMPHWGKSWELRLYNAADCYLRQAGLGDDLREGALSTGGGRPRSRERPGDCVAPRRPNRAQFASPRRGTQGELHQVDVALGSRRASPGDECSETGRVRGTCNRTDSGTMIRTI